MPNPRITLTAGAGRLSRELDPGVVVLGVAVSAYDPSTGEVITYLADVNQPGVPVRRLLWQGSRDDLDLAGQLDAVLYADLTPPDTPEDLSSG